MDAMRHIRLTALVIVTLSASCLPEPEPSIDEATVLSDNTSVRIDAASSARTMFTLNEGERVSVIEKRGTWYRVRDRDQIEGWMEESTILPDSVLQTMQRLLADSASEPVQNMASALEEVNLRIAPGRDTDIVRRLRRGSRLAILDRSTTPRPETDTTDVWFKVRPSDDEIGWVYGQLIEIDTPEPLAGFTEGRSYVAVQPLRQVEDPEVGSISWYVVAERRPDSGPDVAFDGVRVFVWDLNAHQYETTLRLRNLHGLYPLERIGDLQNPGFRFYVEDTDGGRVAREFQMRGSLPREARN